MHKKWINFTKSYKTTTTQHSPSNKQNPNKKPNQLSRKFIEETRVVIPYIKGLSEQCRCTLAKYKVKEFSSKEPAPSRHILKHPKDPMPNAQKTDITYHRKFLAHNCTAGYIGERNRSLKKRVSDCRNQTTIAIRSTTSLQKTQKAELKDLKIIDRDSNTQHHQGKEELHICIQDPSVNSQNPFSIQETSQTSHTTKTAR